MIVKYRTKSSRDLKKIGGVMSVDFTNNGVEVRRGDEFSRATMVLEPGQLESVNEEQDSPLGGLSL